FSQVEGDTTVAETGDTTVAETSDTSMLEEVYKDRIAALEDTLFLKKEQLEAANFMVRQGEVRNTALANSLTTAFDSVKALNDSLTLLGSIYDRVEAESKQHLEQLSALGDSIARNFQREQALAARYDSLTVLLQEARQDLALADSLERSTSDSIAALEAILAALEVQLSENKEGLSGMYDRLKLALQSTEEGHIDSATDMKYVEHLREAVDYKRKGKGFKLFGGGDETELNSYRFAELIDYMYWSQLGGSYDQALNLLARTYYQQDKKIFGALTYLKTIFLFPDTDAGKSAAEEFEKLVKKEDEVGRLYYEVALNPDSMNVGNEDFYRYLHFLDYIRNLNAPEARKYFISEGRTFLAYYPGIFQADQITLWVAQAYHGLEEYNAEILALFKIRTMYPESDFLSYVTYTIADITVKNLEQYELAATRYAAFLDEFPDDVNAPQALLSQADIYETKIKDYKQAGDLFRKLTDTYPDDELAPQALFRYATLLTDKLASPAGALAVYQEILSTYGADQDAGTRALNGLATISSDTRQYEAAVTYYLDIHQRYPEANEEAVKAIIAAADIYEKNLKNIDATIHTLHIIVDNYEEYPGMKAINKRIQKLQKKQ
ncbi:MAG: tetratricopeptide repeat protein, partial [Candidatus Marinimicrobia bacterium]|nr:tetratricopeptide repeat protein [Candidatus Neomarinimicrobiota bacterium]